MLPRYGFSGDRKCGGGVGDEWCGGERVERHVGDVNGGSVRCTS